MTESLRMVVSHVGCYYDKPIPDRTIAKVNMLDDIVDYINEEANLSIAPDAFDGLENEMFAFLGGAKSDLELRYSAEKLCVAVPEFLSYLLYCDTFGDQKLTGLSKYVFPIRKRILDKAKATSTIFRSVKRSKFCIWVNDTLYYSLPLGTRVNLPSKVEYIE
jgi:hypothetical protein